MSPWADRRTQALLERARQFLDALEAHPGWRSRLRAAGYSQAAHRELQTLVALVEASWEGAGTAAGLVRRGTAQRAYRGELAPQGAGRATSLRKRPFALGARAWALGVWTGEQVGVAGAAARKVPAVWREAQRVVRRARRGARPAGDVARDLWRVLRRVGRDEHLGHFLTAAGLRDARSALRRRLRDGGAADAEHDRQQAAYALSYTLARWREAARGIFAENPEALRELGIAGRAGRD